MNKCQLENCNNLIKLNRDKYCSQKCYWKSLIGNKINNGRIRTEEQKKKYSESHKGKKLSEETKQKLREIRIGYNLSNNIKQKISLSNKNKKRTEKQKQNISKAHMGQKAWNKGLTKETDERVKKNALEVSKILKGRKNLEHSNRMKQQWQNPEYIQKQKEARKLFPNNSELYLQNILNFIIPNQFKYVGDFSKFIGNKCPDFIDSINNKIIELYGDYWHQNDDPQDRIDYFKNYGYDTLIIWGSELKDINSLKNKIKRFI